MADLTNLIAAGPPAYSLNLQGLFDAYRKGKDAQYTDRNRDLFANGLPQREGGGTDWGKAMESILRAGGAQGVSNAVNLSGLDAMDGPSLLGPSGQQSGAQQQGGGGSFDQVKTATTKVESGGDYGAIGPLTRDGDRAWGRYQVKGSNVGPWTKEVTGREMSPEEFRKNPKVQDAVYNHKMGQYLQETGGDTQKAHLKWFTGRTDAGALNLDDKYINGAQYLQRTAQAGGGGGQAPQSNLMSGFVPPRWAGREGEYASALLDRASKLEQRKPGSGKGYEEAGRAILRSLEQNADEVRKRESTVQKENLERDTAAQKTLYPRADTSLEKAQAAAQDIRGIHDARQLLDQGIISGLFANEKLALAKFGSALGVPDDKITNTEAFGPVVAQRVVGLIRNFGSGTGLSEGDRQYAKQMAAGEIKFEESSIRRIFDIYETASRATLARHGKLIGGMTSSSSAFKGIADTYKVEEPGTYKAPPKQAKGEPGAPVEGAKKAPDGNWYVPDPKRAGKYLLVKQ